MASSLGTSARFLFLVGLVGLVLWQGAEAKVQNGSLNTNNDWMFISKFCYNTLGLGNLTWTVWGEDTSNLLLLFYDDAYNSWGPIYAARNALSCQQKVSLSIANRTVVSGETRLQPFKDSTRPYFWYFVISNCGATSPLNIQYNFEMTNSGGKWNYQLSFDEEGLPQAYLFFLVVFLVGAGIHFVGVVKLIRSGGYHPIVKMLTLSLVLELVFIFFVFIHYAIYMNNGIGSPGLFGFAQVLDDAFELVFMFLLVLLAKGWTITKNQITDKLALIVIMCIFFIAYICMIVWEYVGTDPASSLYEYENIPGIAIQVLRLLVLVWFLWCLRNSRLEESHPLKRRFYLVFGSFYTLWFLALPLIVVIASILAQWTRYKIVASMYLCLNTLALLFLGYLLWPSRAQEIFAITKTDVLLGTGSHQGSSTSPYESL